MKNKLILTVGLPRSGKSTWSMKQGCPVVNPDSIRLALHGKAFISESEDFVWAIARNMVNALFIAGHKTVIVDATNITQERRKFWQKIPDADIHYRIFDTDKSVCISRAKNSGREDIIPIIERMALKYEPLFSNEMGKIFKEDK